GTSVTGLAHGTHSIRLALELERTRVCSDVAVHRCIGVDPAYASRGRETLESTVGREFPRAWCGQQCSTLESSSGWERAQWSGVKLPSSPLQPFSSFARAPGRKRLPMAWEGRPRRKRFAPGTSPSARREKSSRKGTGRPKKARLCSSARAAVVATEHRGPEDMPRR